MSKLQPAYLKPLNQFGATSERRHCGPSLNQTPNR